MNHFKNKKRDNNGKESNILLFLQNVSISRSIYTVSYWTINRYGPIYLQKHRDNKGNLIKAMKNAWGYIPRHNSSLPRRNLTFPFPPPPTFWHIPFPRTDSLNTPKNTKSLSLGIFKATNKYSNERKGCIIYQLAKEGESSPLQT